MQILPSSALLNALSTARPAAPATNAPVAKSEAARAAARAAFQAAQQPKPTPSPVVPATPASPPLAPDQTRIRPRGSLINVVV
jgi:hypothetical protein